MLSMLEITCAPERKLLSRLWYELRKPAVSACLRPVENVHYMHITCEKRKERIDWRLISSYSLDCSERILIPKGIEPPADCDMRRLIPHEFQRRMIENLAMDILVCSEKKPELRRVAVYGQDTEVNALLPRLIKLAGEVRVITRRACAVMDTVEELRAKNGAAIGVTDSFDACGFDMLVAPAGGASVFELSSDTIVLSPDRPQRATNLWIKDAIPAMPPCLENIYSEVYDLTEFIGGFYEAAGMRDLGRLPASAGVTESGQIQPREAAALINR